MGTVGQIVGAEPVWLHDRIVETIHTRQLAEHGGVEGVRDRGLLATALAKPLQLHSYGHPPPDLPALAAAYAHGIAHRSEEHTSELQSLMRNSYAAFCLKTKHDNQDNLQLS